MATATATPDIAERTDARSQSDQRPRRQPPYNVVLIDDPHHSYQYVIDMLGRLFGYSSQKGYKLAEEVDTTGRAIVATTTLEHAELKRDQIHGFGPDKQVRQCKGSMTAVLEPSE